MYLACVAGVVRMQCFVSGRAPDTLRYKNRATLVSNNAPQPGNEGQPAVLIVAIFKYVNSRLLR